MKAHGLTGINKVFYETAYSFEMEHGSGNEYQAHAVGLKETERIAKLRKEAETPRMYVDLSTGRRFMATENELESMHS